MPMRQRSEPNSKYKFGFNGKEKDSEININGGDFPMAIGIRARIYDTRLGRCLSLDKTIYSFPWNSSFLFADNQPIWNFDIDGNAAWPTTSQKNAIASVLFSIYVEEKNSINIIIKRTCEDLIIGLIIDFSKTQGYPFTL